MSSEGRIGDWVRRAVQGDVYATQKLIVAYHARLRAMAAQRVAPDMRSKIEPEDVLQQVYTDVMERITSFDYKGPTSFFGWLARILESKLVDAHRHYHAVGRDVRRETTPGSASRFGFLAARVTLDSLTPSRIVAREETEALVMAALAGLSSDHRRVLELRFLKGHSLAEVAELMSRSTPAAQMLCGRALRRLRESLSQLSRTG